MLLEAARAMLETRVRREMAGSLGRWVGLTRSRGRVDHGRRGGEHADAVQMGYKVLLETQGALG